MIICLIRKIKRIFDGVSGFMKEYERRKVQFRWY